jgi:hypothetical protein
MLAVIRHIKEFGLTETVEKFKLKSRVYEHKVHLKYDQINSSYEHQEVQDCRGLILHKNSWDVMSMSFRKFFNIQEGHAHKIDWDSAIIYEKLDGSMMQVYWDEYAYKWFAATTGTAEGEGEVNNKMGTTFNDLFWQTTLKYDYNIVDLLNKKFTYVFELTSPYNIVVKPHGVSEITLLAVRNNKTLVEKTYTELLKESEIIKVPVVKTFDFKSMGVNDIHKTLENMAWSEEGYVVCDKNFNRVKIKNPAYCAVHHLKGKTAEHNILTIIKTNEIEEFAATFPDRKEELLRLKTAYDKLVGNLNNVWNELQPELPKNISAPERKKYATAVFAVVEKYNLKGFSGLFFNLQLGKATSVEDYMKDYDDKVLYKLL